MGLIKSFKRWNSIIINLKRDQKRIDNNQMNLQRMMVKGFPNLENDGLDFKSRMVKHEAKVYSQNGEDGLLMFILNEIGAEYYTIVEIGIGNGSECNSRNMIENFGWKAWLIDGSDLNVFDAKIIYEKQIDDGDVFIQNRWVTRENIDEIIQETRIPRNIDILSIDIDGNDYWVWDSISTVKPRVVIIEYNASFGPDKSITVPYDPEFERFKKHNSGYYHGASLNALEKLGHKKGYSLICCDSSGSNAIFIKDEVIYSKGIFEAHCPSSAFYPLRKRIESMSLEGQFNLIKHLDIVDI